MTPSIPLERGNGAVDILENSSDGKLGSGEAFGEATGNALSRTLANTILQIGDGLRHGDQ
jgi:hypothetical protein